MFKATYPNLPAAVGAWVAGEMYAAMQRPADMLPGSKSFTGVTFMHHLDGMIDDLIDLCATEVRPNEPVTLCIAPQWPTGIEAQSCLQGYAWFEQEETK